MKLYLILTLALVGCGREESHKAKTAGSSDAVAIEGTQDPTPEAAPATEAVQQPVAPAEQPKPVDTPKLAATSVPVVPEVVIEEEPASPMSAGAPEEGTPEVAAMDPTLPFYMDITKILGPCDKRTGGMVASMSLLVATCEGSEAEGYKWTGRNKDHDTIIDNHGEAQVSP